MSSVRGSHAWLADRSHCACNYHQWVESHVFAWLIDTLIIIAFTTTTKKTIQSWVFCRITRSYVLFFGQLNILLCGTLVCILLIDGDVGKINNFMCHLERPESGSCWLKQRQMGTLGVYMKEVLLWMVRWTRRASTRHFCSALAAVVSPVRNITFLTAHFFALLVPSASNLGRQSCWVTCLCGSGAIQVVWTSLF